MIRVDVFVSLVSISGSWSSFGFQRCRLQDSGLKFGFRWCRIEDLSGFFCFSGVDFRMWGGRWVSVVSISGFGFEVWVSAVSIVGSGWNVGFQWCRFHDVGRPLDVSGVDFRIRV
jgi:hypothetical protein